MTVKQKIIQEIEGMPEPVLEQLYSYLKFFKKINENKGSKALENFDWDQFTVQEFFKGYSQSDEIYDKL